MKIEVLGCSGSVMPGYNTTSILVNGHTLVDAGSAASVLSEESISAIRNILITHSHIDHIKELPFILDMLFSSKGNEVTVWGSRETVKGLHENIFNGMIWPEIRELNANRKFVGMNEIPEDEFTLGELKIHAFPAKHITGSLSLLFSDEHCKVLFSGDTGYDEGFFDLIRSLNPRLRAVFLEVSFPNRMNDFADLTRHLTPCLLEKGLGKGIPSTMDIIAYHIKPKYLDEVVAELPANVAYISGGEVFEF